MEATPQPPVFFSESVSSPRFTRFDGRSHVPVCSFSLWTLTYAQDCECVEACSDDDVSVCGKRFRK